MATSTHDIVIVGYGPVGQYAAALLGQGGWSVAVLEKHHDLYGLPRAGHVDHEFMRQLQEIGAVDEVLIDATESTEYVFKNQHGEHLVTFDWDHDGVSGWHSDYYLNQPDLELALDRAARSHDNVSVHMAREVVSIDQTDESVTVRARARDDDSDVLQIEARYLIACDGGSSFVRPYLGVKEEDLGFDQGWIVLDYAPTEPIHFDFDNGQICDPARPMNLFQLGRRHRRFAMMAMPGESWEWLSEPDTAWHLMERFGVHPGNARLVRNTVYRFQSKVAEDFRVGRCFLAGDAAHVMPPFMGQGLCSGFRDISNLAWKLGDVLSGRASDALLDTYQVERREHSRALTELSMAAGRISCTTDPQLAEERDRGYREGTIPPPPPFPKLEGGLLHRAANGQIVDPVGQLAPQGTVTVGDWTGRFDDHFGTGWTVLSLDVDPTATLDADLVATATELGLRFVTVHTDGNDPADVDGIYAEYFADHGAVAIVYRPDFYLFGLAPDVEALEPIVKDFIAVYA